MQLALGTVQFGLGYGVAGRGEAVPEPEVRSILACAYEHGVLTLDTAAAYGDIEGRLAKLAGSRAFRVVTKLPALPAGLTDAGAAEWAAARLQAAHERLGDLLDTLMFHRAEDLLGEHAAALWDTCAGWAHRHGVRLGVSGYEPQIVVRVRRAFPIGVAQLPGNALDQRLLDLPPQSLDKTAIHVRSAFLQGLLLMPQANASARVPAARAALARWHGWLGAQGLDALPAALSLVKSLPHASHCVVGVDSLTQFESISKSWSETAPLREPSLSCPDPDIIDPRRWPSAP